MDLSILYLLLVIFPTGQECIEYWQFHLMENSFVHFVFFIYQNNVLLTKILKDLPEGISFITSIHVKLYLVISNNNCK